MARSCVASSGRIRCVAASSDRFPDHAEIAFVPALADQTIGHSLLDGAVGFRSVSAVIEAAAAQMVSKLRKAVGDFFVREVQQFKLAQTRRVRYPAPRP